jgi:hypothetical protein
MLAREAYHNPPLPKLGTDYFETRWSCMHDIIVFNSIDGDHCTVLDSRLSIFNYLSSIGINQGCFQHIDEDSVIRLFPAAAGCALASPRRACGPCGRDNWVRREKPPFYACVRTNAEDPQRCWTRPLTRCA